MELFDYPNTETLNKRRNWIYSELELSEKIGSYLMSDHSIALFMDMQMAFCSGAWISVVITSVSVIDAHLRETEAMDTTLGTAKLLSDYYVGENIDWLRKLRNKYVHHNLDRPTFEMNDWFSNQKQMEADATIAIKMTIAAFFQSPGT